MKLWPSNGTPLPVFGRTTTVSPPRNPHAHTPHPPETRPEWSQLTENALRNTRHWMMPSIVSPVSENVPVRWRPLRPTAEASEACTSALRLPCESGRLGGSGAVRMNRSSESIVVHLLRSTTTNTLAKRTGDGDGDDGVGVVVGVGDDGVGVGDGVDAGVAAPANWPVGAMAAAQRHDCLARRTSSACLCVS